MLALVGRVDRDEEEVPVLAVVEVSADAGFDRWLVDSKHSLLAVTRVSVASNARTQSEMEHTLRPLRPVYHVMRSRPD